MTSSNGNIFRVTGPLCGEFTGPGEFPTQRPVTRSFDVFFDRRLNKRSSKQPRGWWLETLSCSLWRQSNAAFVTSMKLFLILITEMHMEFIYIYIINFSQWPMGWMISGSFYDKCTSRYFRDEYTDFRILTHWGRDEMNNISQTTFSYAISSMKVFEFRLQFHWTLFPRVQLTIFQLGSATSHYLKQWWLDYWRIYASLGLNELTHRGQMMPYGVIVLGQDWFGLVAWWHHAIIWLSQSWNIINIYIYIGFIWGQFLIKSSTYNSLK